MIFIALCAYKAEANAMQTSSNSSQFHCFINTDYQKSQKSGYLLNVNNTVQNYINLTRIAWLLVDLPLDPNSFSLLNQKPVTS
jgi:hypothetical protein